MNYREIPAGSTEIQTGLWLYEYTTTIGGTEYTFREIFSAEGYCFYQLSQPENYDEDNNLKPAEERIYATWMSCAISDTVETINADVVSVPYVPGYEVVSVSNPTETA